MTYSGYVAALSKTDEHSHDAIGRTCSRAARQQAPPPSFPHAKSPCRSDRGHPEIKPQSRNLCHLQDTGTVLFCAQDAQTFLCTIQDAGPTVLHLHDAGAPTLKYQILSPLIPSLIDKPTLDQKALLA